MLKRLGRLIVRSRVIIIVLVLVVTAGAAYFAGRVRLSSDLIDLAPENNPQLIALRETLAKFGSSTFIMIAVEAEDPFSHRTLVKMREIGEHIRKLPDVEEVIDPVNAAVFKPLFGTVAVKKVFPGGDIPESPEKLRQIKKDMLSEPLLENVVVSENGDSLALYVRMKNGTGTTDLRDRLSTILRPYQGPETFYMAGGPIIESWVQEYLSRDSVRLALPILLLVVLVLFVNFRSIRGVLLPLFIMLASILWTLGLMGLLGRKITIVGVMLPTLILIISSSYSIHFLNQYFRNIFDSGPRIQRVEHAFSSIGRTIILAAMTTIAGFAALTVNRIRPMMELGIFVLIGVFIGMALSLTFLPSTLSMLPVPGKRLHAASETSGFNRLFCSLESVVVHHRWIILAVAVVIAAWSVAGMHNIVVDTTWKRFFREDSRVIQSQTFITNNYGGVSTINVSFWPEEGSSLDFRRLDALRHVDTMQQWIDRQGLFGKTTSLVDYIKRANQILSGNDPGAYRLPGSDADLLRILLMFNMANLTEKLGNVVTDDYRYANITVRSAKPGKQVTIAETREFLDAFYRFVDQNPHPDMSTRIAGIDLIYVSLVDYLVRSQLTSIALSVVIVFIIMAFTFRSLTYGLFGLIPIVFGLLLNFAAMSYFNIALDFITSMIASIAVGLGVDNAIHYLIRFSRTDRNLPLAERIGCALTASGIPIFFTSLTLIAGFSVLLFSSFKPILYFGLLIAVTMLGCLIGVIFILPALIYLIKPKGIVGRAAPDTAGSDR